MPYVIRKKIKLVYDRGLVSARPPLILGIQLDDDSLPKHYMLDSGIKTLLRGTATLLVDKNNHVKCVINKDYDFQIHSIGNYTVDGRCVYDRRLLFPQNLVRDFALDVDMGIELLLREIITGNEVEKIFSEMIVEGSMEFEPKITNGEVLPSSELLITTKFTDGFYDKLTFEINNAFRMRLFTATMVLVRKLFEDLIIDLLRQKYGERPPDKELYYSMSDKRFHIFSTLIRNLEAHVDDFKAHSSVLQWDKSKNDFFKFLRDIKERGDASAHSIELIHDPNEINTLKPLLNKYSDLIVRLIQRIVETPHNS
jgi:hypothetical protein